METITAISTAYGLGGIALIRVSGPDAEAITRKVLGCKPLRDHHATFVSVKDLDDLVVTLFRAPHSFTGEEVVEISCHGSLYVQNELLRRLIDAGCRQARGGEFTQRAFLNGKMDLTQAEAVADLIASETQAEKDLALSQLRGGISSELATLRERLLTLTSLLELELDFGDHEELEFADRHELLALCDLTHTHLAQLTSSFRAGNAVKNGIPVAIVGKTNAGKSTLLNALLGEERAIVSDQVGTTRDTVEDRLIIGGVLFRLIDTAGLRETQDTVEALGIERSRKAMTEAQIILHVVDATNPEPALDASVCAPQATVIEVMNKCDLVSGIPNGISAKNGNLGDLREQLLHAAACFRPQGVTISNARHYEALTRADAAILRVQEGLHNGLSGDLVALDLNDCLNAIGEVTGQITNNEVLGNIFSKFCIGK